MRIWWRGVLLAVLVSVAADAAAQALYGSLLGNVTDETGAALPGATVTITQRETNLTRDVVTDEVAATTCQTCCRAPIRSSSSLPAFRPSPRSDIAVRQGLDVRVDAKLKLGTLQESIIVSGEAAVPADRERRGAVADDEQISW